MLTPQPLGQSRRHAGGKGIVANLEWWVSHRRVEVFHHAVFPCYPADVHRRRPNGAPPHALRAPPSPWSALTRTRETASPSGSCL